MRGGVDGLVTPHPLGASLPAIYIDDAFTQGLCAALDDVLAPVIGTLDSFPAYLDPRTTPEDMLDWLAGWVGVALDSQQSSSSRRASIARGVELHQWRGTVRGIRESVLARFGHEPEVIETGAVSWSGMPGAPLPGESVGHLLVRLRVPDVSAVDVRSLDLFVAALKPAHVPHDVEVLLSLPAG